MVKIDVTEYGKDELDVLDYVASETFRNLMDSEECEKKRDKCTKCKFKHLCDNMYDIIEEIEGKE